MSVHLAAADPAGVRALADAGRRPHHDRRSLALHVRQRERVWSGLARWFSLAGLDPITRGLGQQRWTVELDAPTLGRLLGPDAAAQLLRRRRLSDESARALLPAYLDPAVRRSIVALEVGEDGWPPAERRLEAPAELAPPPVRGGLTPAKVTDAYHFDRDHDGEGEVIALMAIGGVPSASDLHGFARAFGLPPPQVVVRPLTPLGACADDPRARFETTMALQWLCALAPGARVIVHVIDPAAVADPWGAFLLSVLSDMSEEPSIAVTGWSAPARQYYRVHGRESIGGLLDQAAAAGVTVIAASGDWGAYDGFPSAGPERAWCDALGPHDTFPGAEPRVLSVGGTQVVATLPWREIAWSAPVSAELKAAIGLDRLAGSGGVSRHHLVPDYQRGRIAEAFERSGDAPPIVADGRVQPDVALAAWGPDAGEGGLARPAGYAALVDGVFRDDAGGTSLAAPIWAAIIARVNQARRARGLPRLGWPHPRLYALAGAGGPLRSIREGHTDITLPVEGEGGETRWERLAGFVARPDFDPATGLGVPDVAALTRALAVG
ncbi:MAG: S53 family peptidase [Nannocystaceae bacterium]